MLAKVNCYWASCRELSDRVNQLHSWRLDLNRRKAELERFVPSSRPQIVAPGTHSTADQIHAIERTIAAATAMHEVATAALTEHQEKGIEDARFYDSMKQHLASELCAWGVE